MQVITLEYNFSIHFHLNKFKKDCQLQLHVYLKAYLHVFWM